MTNQAIMTDEQRKQTAAERCAELANKGSSGWNSQHFTSDEFSPVFRAFRREVETIDARDKEVLADLDLVMRMTTNTLAWEALSRAQAKLRADLLPELIDPDLLEAREIAKGHPPLGSDVEQLILAGVKRGRELAKDLGHG